MDFALVFPGQGSQSVGMMAPYDSLNEVRNTFSQASEVLGFDLWDMAQQGPAETLNLTVNTQPLLLTAEVAIYRAWRAAHGPEPKAMAGHSLGEYAALVAAEALSFPDALRTVRFRAEAMQRAVPEGTGSMAAILGMDDERIRQVCRDAAQGEVLEPANFNSPGQVVIAGHKAAVSRGAALATERGARKVMPVAMSVPSHCSLMKPAAEKLRDFIAEIRIDRPRISIIHNADLRAITDPAEIKAALVRQLFSPVRWVDTVKTLTAQGITHFLESGPGKILTGMNKRIDGVQQAIVLSDADAIRQAIALLAQ